MNKKIKIISSVVILSISIIPLLILTFYAHPATDDFGFAYSLNNDSIWKIAWSIFLTMDNRLVGNFLTLLFCQTNHLFMFRLQFFVFILTFFASVFFLFHTINKFLLKCNFENLFLLFAFFVFLFVGYNPGIAECFFWYPGIVIWIGSIVLFNIFLSLIIYEFKSNSENIFRFIGITLLAFVMTSENEIVFVFMGIFGIILLYDLFKLKSQNKTKVIILLVLLVLGALIVIFGHGNYHRLNFISTQQPVNYFKVIKSDMLLYRKIFFLTDIIFFNIILIPFYFKITENSKKHIEPTKLMLVSVGILFILLIPSFIAKLLYSFRIQNVVYYYSLCLIFINFINLSIWLREKNKLKIKKIEFLTALFVGFFFMSYFMQKESTIRTVYTDLFTGKASGFDKEMSSRYTIIKNSKDKDVLVPALKNKPKSIYVDDISKDSLDWRNQVYSDYFQKHTITLEK